MSHHKDIESNYALYELANYWKSGDTGQVFWDAKMNLIEPIHLEAENKKSDDEASENV